MDEFLSLKLGLTQVYLLKAADGYIQIDAGYKSNIDKYFKILEKNNINPEDIKLIIVSHAHSDHVGALKEIKDKTKAKVLVNENDAEYLIKGESAEVKPISIIAKILVKILPEKMLRFDPVQPDIIIKEEFSLEEFGLQAKVVHTPGHTLGTVSVITEEGSAFISCSVHGFPLRMSPGLPGAALDVDEVMKSWEKIIDEGAKDIYIAHGKPFKVDVLKKILKKKKKQ